MVVCDGHDKDGHLVARGVAESLPAIMLRRIYERSPDTLFEPVEDELIYEAFKVCFYKLVKVLHRLKYYRNVKMQYVGDLLN